jgi:hypothetical protein
MRRHNISLFIVLGCLLAGLAQAAEFRFPKNGTTAFLITLPRGWTSKEDDYNGMQLLPADRRSSVYLSVVRDKEYAGKPLMELALAIGKPANITQFPKQEPTALSDRKGEGFYGQMKNANGLLMDVKRLVIPLEPDLWASETIMSSQGLTAAQTASLNQAVHWVGLTSSK